MSDLTPTQRIEAAIVRLEELKANSYPGLWTSTNDDWWWLEGVNHRVVYGQGRAEVAFTHDGDADLICTLHATIDAQLDWLSDQSARMKAEVGTIGTPEVHYRHALALADAIISGGTE